MKMLKKLLAIVLTGAMALTLLTACGGNAVTDKSIADALTDLAKTQSSNATFIPRAKEREMARKIAALYESTVADGDDDIIEEYNNILGYDKGGANENNFVWVAPLILTDELGTSGQAMQLIGAVLPQSYAENDSKLTGKTPADTRYMGTALCKGPDEDGKLTTVRIIVVTATAEPVDKK